MKSYRDDDERLHLMGSPLRVDELPTPGEVAKLALHFLPLHAVDKDASLAMIHATKLAVELWRASKDALLNAASISREYWKKQDQHPNYFDSFFMEAAKRIQQNPTKDIFEETITWAEAAARLLPDLSSSEAMESLIKMAKDQGMVKQTTTESVTQDTPGGEIKVSLGSRPFQFVPDEVANAHIFCAIFANHSRKESARKKAEGDKKRKANLKQNAGAGRVKKRLNDRTQKKK